MSRLPWFKCYQQDLLDGMAGMPADERGIYISILCLIYRNWGPIRDEPREIAYHCGCTVKQWTKFRAALILHGKLKVVEIDGREHLTNERCEEEFAAHETRCAELSERGKNGAKKRREKITTKANENNAGDQATAKPSLSRSQAEKESEEDTSVVPSNDETTGAGAPPDPNKQAWDLAVGALVGQGKMTPDSARSLFGKLLSANGLQARDMLGPLGECMATCTPDPQGYLTKAAQSRAKRRQATGPPKRVGWV